MNFLDQKSETESTSTISFKGYQIDRLNMRDIQSALNLKSASAAARVSMRVTKSLCLAINHDPILAEFFARLQGYSGLPSGIPVLP